MSIAYRVYATVKGDKKRHYIAGFVYGDDAYQYAVRVSSGRYGVDDRGEYVIQVKGWDNRIWWKFRKGQQIGKGSRGQFAGDTATA